MKLSKPRAWWIASIAIQAGAASLVIAFGRLGQVPVHFDWSGRADLWASRRDVALIILGLAAATAVLAAGLPALSGTRIHDDSANTARPPTAPAVLQATLPLISLFLAALALGVIRSSTAALFAFVSALLLVLGLWLGKVEPNPVVGIRTYWSLRSRLAWDKSNRLFGRLAFWSGLVGLLATPLAPQPLSLRLMIAAVIGAALLAVFESWRVWRGDPERLSRG